MTTFLGLCVYKSDISSNNVISEKTLHEFSTILKITFLDFKYKTWSAICLHDVYSFHLDYDINVATDYCDQIHEEWKVEKIIRIYFEGVNLIAEYECTSLFSNEEYSSTSLNSVPDWLQ